MPSRSGPEAASGFSGVRRDCACTEMALRRWGATPAGGKGRQSSAKLASVDFCGCLWRALQNSILENSGEVGRFSCLGCASGQGPSPRFPRFPNRGASEATGFHLRELLLPGSLDRWRRTPARAPGMVLGGKTRCHHCLRQRFAPLVYRSVTVLRDRIGVSPTTQGTRPVRRWARPFQSDG